MAVRNGAEYLGQAMESLLQQTLTDFELVIVDDASDSPTRAALAFWAAKDARIALQRNETPAGLPVSLNRGLERCRSPIIARADADDLHDPRRLERQFAHLKENPKIGVLSCAFRRIDADGRHIDITPALTGSEQIRFQMLFMNGLLHPGAMFRADLVRSVGGYDPRYWTAQDSDLWARLLPLTKFDNLAEPLVSYRIHPGSIVRSRGEAGRALSLTVPARLQARYLGRQVSDDEVRATVDTFQSFEPLPCDRVFQGARRLADILEIAEAREPPEVRARFRIAVARALVRQARWNGRRAPAGAAAIAALSATWRFKFPERVARVTRRLSGVPE